MMPKSFNLITKTILGITLIALYACSEDDGPTSLNSEGDGPTSLNSLSIPNIPENFAATTIGHQVVLNWQAPSSDGGSAIIHYRYRVRQKDSPGSWSPDWTIIFGEGNARIQTVTGLTSGMEYAFELQAVNEIGESLGTSITSTVIVTPHTPGSFTATAVDFQIVLNWQAPLSNGGSAITHYSYRVRRGDSESWDSSWIIVAGGGGARSQTIPGLTNNEEYIFELQAVNGTGGGPAASSSATLMGEPFESVWRTTSPNESITLPLRSSYNYDFIVDWGDGSSSQITAHDDPDRVHTYTTAGDHIVSITGVVEAWYFNNGGSKDNLIEVTNLGTVGWKNLERAFYGCSNLTTFEGGDVSGVTNMRGMFRSASNITPNTSEWDTSSVTNMSYMFRGASESEPDTRDWDTSKVTNMSNMFTSAIRANPNTRNWDTSSVTNMSSMFSYASAANPDTTDWDTSKVTNMSNMFNSALLANPNTRNWDTSKVTDMSSMFWSADLANPNVSGWDTSRVTNMAGMFNYAASAEPDMSQWDFGNVTTMEYMLGGITIPTANYSALLNRIVDTSSKENITLSGGSSKYNSSASAARATLVDDRNWTITDGGLEN